MRYYPAIPRTPLALHLLERALCQNHGDLPRACKAIKVSHATVTQWQRDDPEAAARIREAQMVGWATLESAAYQRAVVGIEKPVWYQGEQVGTEKVYSDGLLAQMLKARVPGYGEDDSGPSRVTLNVAIMPRAETYTDWVAQREKMLAPVRTIEARPKSKLRDVL
jgi:hypothetical protein